MARNYLGRLQMLFASTILAGSLVMALMSGAFTIDFVALLLLRFGRSVEAGNNLVAKLSIGILAYYSIISVWTLTMMGTRINIPHIATAFEPSSDIQWLVPAIGTLGIWSTVIAVLLVRSLRSPLIKVGQKGR